MTVAMQILRNLTQTKGVKDPFDTQIVAQDALEKLKPLNGSTLDDMHMTADRYLKAIEENGNLEEQQIAGLVRKELSPDNLGVARVTFKALSKPLTVPIGPALAGIATQLYSGMHSKTETAAPFLDGMGEYGTDQEKLFTDMARRACDHVYEARATQIQQGALEKISQGFAQPMKDELLEFGCRSVQLADGEGDAGLPYLSAIEKYGGPKEQQFVAETRAVMEDVSIRYQGLGTMAFQAACHGIGGPVGMALTQLAAKASDRWFRSSPLCRAFLGSIERTVENKDDEILANTALKVTDGIPDRIKVGTCDRDRRTTEIISRKVFHEILAGESYLDEKLASLGKTVTSEFIHQSDLENARSTMVLQKIAEHASIPENKKIAEDALKRTEGATPFFFPSRKLSADLRIHQQAYQDIQLNSKRAYIDANMKTSR